MLGSLRAAAAGGALPKGMSAETSREITRALREADGARSASEVAAAVGTSRVTARRYLEHLAEQGSVEPGAPVRRQRPTRGRVPLAAPAVAVPCWWPRRSAGGG